MAKGTRAPDDFDSPWKDALQRYLRLFLAFFFPAIEADIDWGRGYEGLDKEFQQIIRRAKVGKGLADKLFKVWLLDGREHWLLIHVEVQGTYDKTFPERMFRYNLAAYALYNREVVSVAVLCRTVPPIKTEDQESLKRSKICRQGPRKKISRCRPFMALPPTNRCKPPD